MTAARWTVGGREEEEEEEKGVEEARSPRKRTGPGLI